jgi:hypothetical protein
MKHQYFGDINDYRKYGILRALSTNGLKITVCWMLTENDARTDGQRINYLEQPERFGNFDPVLFDSLHSALLQNRKRAVDWVESHKLIPSARYHAALLTDELEKRSAFFQELSGISLNGDIIFFDPDNGLEVKSKPKGKKDSCKYLYWDEVAKIWKLGYSLLIYQHFPRVNRLGYIRKVSKALCKNIRANEIITFRTSTVAFFLLPQSRHQKKIHSAVEFIRVRWKRMIDVV